MSGKRRSVLTGAGRRRARRRPARRPARFHPPIADPADGRWTLSHGAQAATIWADAVDYLLALSGRNDHPDLQPGGKPRAKAAAATARVVF